MVVQMPRTEIDMYNLLVAEYPTDPAGDGYTMAEAHFYPYQYSLMEKDESWGAQFFYWDGMNSTTDTKHNMGATVSSLGSKAHIDQQFDKLKTAPKGYSVNHPHIDLLCAKDFTFGMPVPDSYFTQGDWVARVADDLQHTLQVERFLNYVYE